MKFKVRLGLLLALDPHCRGKLLQPQYCLTLERVIWLKMIGIEIKEDKKFRRRFFL